MADDFGKYGIELVDLFLGAITPPEEVQKLIDERSGMGAIGDMNAYMTFKPARAIGDAASQPGGGAGGTVGAGLGIGMGAGLGAMLPGMMREAMQGGAAPAAPAAPAAAAAAPAGNPVADKLRQLKSLLDEGLISQEEFNAKRQKLLDEM